MTLAERVYAEALRAASPLLFRLARGDGKLARGIRARRGVPRRMEAWAAAGRDAGKPLVWFHAPSVGEGRQALALLRAFQRRRPDVQTVFTHFSPSAEAFARAVPADFADYLPLDVPADVDRALAALRPAVLAFSKADVWPTLTARAVAWDVR
ncbi:MAG: glycosyltransferase N-terminal domain-containing protein, partial [Longimicrobiaceae bacterium]